MIEGALVAVSLVALTAIGALGWQIYRADKRGDQLITEREAHGKTTLDRDRLRFEAKNKDAEIQRLNKTIEGMAKEPDANPNADLAPDDVLTRGVRAAAEARAAQADRAGALPAVADAEGVHPQGATDVGPATEVLPAGPLDPNESLL